MQIPEVPQFIDRDAWLGALTSVGILKAGQRLVSIEADPHTVTFTFHRENDVGEILTAGSEVAKVTVTVGILPKLGGS